MSVERNKTGCQANVLQIAPINRRQLLAGAAVSAIVGLGGFPKPAVAQGLTKVPFQLSWVKSIQYGGYFAGIENGFYKDEGIDPVFNSGGPGIDAVANVATGRSVLGDRPSAPLIIAREKGIPIKIIATVFHKSPGSIMSPANKPIKSIKELEGKTLALPNSAKSLVAKAMKDAGVSNSAVTLVPVGSDPGILASGQVDAYYGYSTNQGLMLKARGFDIFVLNLHDAGAANTAGTIYAKEDYLAANKDAVVRWLRASIRGWRWALDNPEKTADLMVNKYGAPGLDKEQQLAEIKASKEFITGGTAEKNGILSIDPATVQAMIDDMRAAGLVKTKLGAADLCDPQYVNEALKAL